MKVKALTLVFLITFSFLSALTFYAIPSVKAAEELMLSHTDTSSVGWADMKEEHPSEEAYPKRSAQGQALTNTATNFTVTTVSVYLRKTGSPTSDLVIHINDDIAGTVGTNGRPSDGAWDYEAQSGVVAASSVGTSAGWVNFTFTDEFVMLNETDYCVYLVINSTEVDNDNYISKYCDTNSGHSGNRMGYQYSDWVSIASYDDLFKIYGEEEEAGESYPQYSSVGKTYEAVAGDQPTFYAYWTTSTGSLSYWIFWSNNTGTPTNASAVAFSGGSWSNKTNLTLNTTGDCWVQWKIYANNTDGNWNVTAVQTFYVFDEASPVSRRVFGVTNVGARASIYYNGSKEAIYVAYLNTTFTYWKFQIRAYDLEASAWTAEYNITKSPTNDQHWTPSISVLPNSHLIFLYYYDATNETLQFNYRLSTYSADEQSNLATLISSWGNEKIINYGDQWSYPQPVRWDDRLVIFGRQGLASGGNWTFTIYQNWTDIDFWVNANTTDYTEWLVSGSQPYLDASESYIETGTGVTSYIEQGYFTFPDISDLDIIPDPELWEVSLTVNCTQCIGISAIWKVYLYNGSMGNWHEIGSETDDGVFTYDVSNTLSTPGLVNNAKIYLSGKGGSTGNVRIARAYLTLNYSGFSLEETHLITLEPSASGTPYAVPSRSGNNLLVSWSKSVASSDTNVYFIYSPDKGDNWKLVNGTAISSLPINGDTGGALVVASGHRTRAGSAIIDENGNPAILLSNTSGYVNWFDWKVKVAQYNTTLGSVGEWNISNAVDENGDDIYGTNPMNLGQSFFNCSFYGLPSFWSSATQSDYKVTKYVRYPNQTHKFYAVWSDTVTSTGIKTAISPQCYVQNTPDAYEVVLLERWHEALGNRTVGSNQQLVANTEAWGIKYTANVSCTLIGAEIYGNMSSGADYKLWKVAIYNSTFDLLGYTEGTYLTTGGATGDRVDWLLPNSFSSLPTLEAGQTYWIFFKINQSSVFSYFYDNVGSTVNQTTKITTTYAASWASTISPTTYYNRSMAISAYPTYLIVRGVGVDEYVMAFSNTGSNETKPEFPCRFYTYVQDATGLSYANFRHNNTGSWDNSTYLALSGSESWANFTLTLNETKGAIVIWEIRANDTADNWSNTGTQTLQIAWYYVVPENVVIVVAATVIRLFVKIVTDTLTILSAVSRLFSSVRTFSQTISLSNFGSRASITFDREVFQALSLSDLATKLRTVPASISQTLSFTTATSKVSTLYRSQTETVAISNLPDRASSIFKTNTQSLTLQAHTSKTFTQIRSITAPLSLTDYASRLLSIFRSSAQQTTLTAYASRTMTATRTTADSLTFSLYAFGERLTLLTRTATQTMSLQTTTARIISLFRTATQQLTLQTTTTKIFRQIRTSLQALTLSAKETRIFIFTRTITQQLSLADFASRIFTGTRKASQTLSFATSTSFIWTPPKSGVPTIPSLELPSFLYVNILDVFVNFFEGFLLSERVVGEFTVELTNPLETQDMTFNLTYEIPELQLNGTDSFIVAQQQTVNRTYQVSIPMGYINETDATVTGAEYDVSVHINYVDPYTKMQTRKTLHATLTIPRIYGLLRIIAWILIIVASILAFIVFVILKRKQSRKEFTKSLNETLEIEKE